MMSTVVQASMSLVMALLVISCIMSMSGAQVQQGGCGPTRDLVVCLPAAEADVQPAPECCSLLQNIYLTTPTPEACLCEAATSPAFQSSGANVQYAIQIPHKCNLNYRAGTQCNGISIPGGH